MKMKNDTYWSVIVKQFKKSKTGVLALGILMLFFLVGLYAPLFASSKPLVVFWDGSLYFPLLRYLFYQGFYTKPIDLFFNLLMFTFPLALFGLWLRSGLAKKLYFSSILIVHLLLFSLILLKIVKNPDNTAQLKFRQKVNAPYINSHDDPLLEPIQSQMSYSQELSSLSSYGKLNRLLDYRNMQKQQMRLLPISQLFAEKKMRELPTLWNVWQRNEASKLEQLNLILQQTEANYQKASNQLPELMEAYRPFSHAFIMAHYALEHADSEEERIRAEKHLNELMKASDKARTPLIQTRQTMVAYQKTLDERNYLISKKEWLEQESQNMTFLLPPLLRTFHWEEDAGGAQEANQFLPWWELTRINRKDLVASLLFGIRVSLVVGTLAILLALLIGIPLGTIAGYFAGKTDLIICRIIEMWEAMPTFFMLLLVIAITQSKSIFLVITILGIFGWTGFSRFMRSEVLKQRKLSYVDACHSLGFTHKRIMFSHILPNAIPPILTLLPFSMMAAITSEAGLSFLGLGEEGSTSWGVLMDEGRSVFPAESYLLWPPAILLTILLISIALVGDALRDAIDPKMRQ